MSPLPRKLALVKPSSERHRSLAKGLVAGFVGGIIATAARSVAEKLYPPAPHLESEPSRLEAKTSTPGRRSSSSRSLTKEALHWGFGAAVGAAYGAAAEIYPDVTAKEGVNFGMALMAVSHEGTLPALGITSKPQTPRERSSAVTSHIVFGVTTEIVRRLVRRAID